jgi:hypothetical protein
LPLKNDELKKEFISEIISDLAQEFKPEENLEFYFERIFSRTVYPSNNSHHEGESKIFDCAVRSLVCQLIIC